MFALQAEIKSCPKCIWSLIPVTKQYNKYIYNNKNHCKDPDTNEGFVRSKRIHHHTKPVSAQCSSAEHLLLHWRRNSIFQGCSCHWHLISLLMLKRRYIQGSLQIHHCAFSLDINYKIYCENIARICKWAHLYTYMRSVKWGTHRKFFFFYMPRLDWKKQASSLVGKS